MGRGNKSKKSSKSKKHKKSRVKSSSESSNSTSSEEEWVEREQTPSTSRRPEVTRESGKACVDPQQDDWLSNAAVFDGITRSELREKRQKNKDVNDEKYMLDRLGQTDRELNPYWKDGGSGLPSEKPGGLDSLRQATATVGDQGVAWLRKALQRAKEQAAEQRRPLEQVVAERWGSLDQLEKIIYDAEKREKQVEVKSSGYRDRETRHYANERETYKDTLKNSSKSFTKPCSSDEDKSCHEKATNKSKSRHEKEKKGYKKNEKSICKPRSRSNSDDSSNNRMPVNSYKKLEKSNDVLSKKFAKPRNSSSEDERTYRREDTRKMYDSDRKNRIKHARHKNYKPSKSGGRNCSQSSSRSSSSEDDRRRRRDDTRKHSKHKSSEKQESHSSFKKPSLDSDEESPAKYSFNSRHSSGQGWRKKTERKENSPESKAVKGSSVGDLREEISGAKEDPADHIIDEPVLTDKEMNDLAAKLVKAELLGNEERVKELRAKLERARELKASKPKVVEAKEEVVILTHTDSKGFTRPVSLGGPLEPSGGRRKAKKVDTHAGGKRTRYFADDDKYNLQEMFQREKMSTVEDSNEVFAKLASKGVGRDDSARDMDDVFEETARMEESEGRKQARDRQHAINESKRVARSLDNCQWCLESKEMLKHLIVAIGNKCYLCVPAHQSLTENHCLIVPTHHTPCATQLDEDVWSEMKDFRKSVVQMFLSQEEDVVFFESARNLNKFPHMVLNCVPMPKETGDLAPIYFKKAIQECEMEWSNNKKLVDLKGKDVRCAVPKGLPYFAVDFGMESGFAHVIEDERLFPPNFAQEIIGGMLDLDHTIWRKQRRQTFEEQSKKVIQLTKLWSPFDCTKKK